MQKLVSKRCSPVDQLSLIGCARWNEEAEDCGKEGEVVSERCTSGDQAPQRFHQPQARFRLEPNHTKL